MTCPTSSVYELDMRAGGASKLWVAGLALAMPLACGGAAKSGLPADAGAETTVGVFHIIDAGSPDADASDASVQSGDGDDVGVALDCTPTLPDGSVTPPFVPPRRPQSVCTASQVLALFEACWAGSTASCNAFYGDPTNSTCIRCMISDSTDPSWGPIVSYPNDTSQANVGGCVALVDQDSGADSCAAAFEAFKACGQESCAAVCPNGSSSGSGAFGTCETLAELTTCAPYTQAAQCDQAPAYASCIFVDFEAYFRGLGDVFCVNGGFVDAGASDAPDSSDN